jgi:RNA polymerase sigma-70 factor (ECF subfamily)
VERFEDRFVEVFRENFRNLYRYLDRLSGDAQLAADLAQEAFVRLHQRGFMPNEPRAWLVTVAMNLYRNARTAHTRRRRLLTVFRNDAGPAAAAAPDAQTLQDELRRKVRSTIDQMPERERQLLLLRAEGYSYRDIAAALELNEASIGTLLARAKRQFRDLYEGGSDAPR